MGWRRRNAAHPEYNQYEVKGEVNLPRLLFSKYIVSCLLRRSAFQFLKSIGNFFQFIFDEHPCFQQVFFVGPVVDIAVERSIHWAVDEFTSAAKHSKILKTDVFQLNCP